MQNLKGKKWGQLTEEQQYDLLSRVVDTIDGCSGSKVRHGECIVDFDNGLSIAGYVNAENDYDIEIDDNSILYDSAE